MSSYRCKLVRESKNVERERARRECVVLGHRVGNQLASKQVKALGFLYPWATVWGRRSSCLRELRSLWLTVRTCDGPTPCNIGWRRRARGSSSQKEKGKTIRRRHVTADHGTQSPSRFHIHRTLPFAANPTAAATPGRTFLPFNQTSFFFFFLLHHHHHQNDHALSLSLETRGGFNYRPMRSIAIFHSAPTFASLSAQQQIGNSFFFYYFSHLDGLVLLATPIHQPNETGDRVIFLFTFRRVWQERWRIRHARFQPSAAALLLFGSNDFIFELFSRVFWFLFGSCGQTINTPKKTSGY